MPHNRYGEEEDDYIPSEEDLRKDLESYLSILRDTLHNGNSSILLPTINGYWVRIYYNHRRAEPNKNGYIEIGKEEYVFIDNTPRGTVLSYKKGMLEYIQVPLLKQES